MSVMNFGSGTSVWLGPAVAGIFLPRVGVAGVIWIFALMYLLSALISMTLQLSLERCSADKAPPERHFKVKLSNETNRHGHR